MHAPLLNYFLDLLTVINYFINAFRQLKQKDKLHDAKDMEIEAMIQGIKSMARTLDATEAQTS